MALQPPAPSPVVSFAKGLVHWLDDTFIDPYRDFYDWISGAGPRGDLIWRYVTSNFSRTTPVGTSEDQAQVGFNVINITGGDIDSSWTTTDYTNCEANLDEFWNAMRSYIAPTHTLVQYRWYIRQFNSALPAGEPVTTLDPATGKPYERFARSGPAARVTARSIAGQSAAGLLPYQVAASVTFRTPTPKHWGRMYIPGVGAGILDGTYGRISNVFQQALANQAAELVDDMTKQEFIPVIPTTQVGSKFHVALQQISSVQVDDIPDVVRRRRPRQALRRDVGVPIP